VDRQRSRKRRSLAVSLAMSAAVAGLLAVPTTASAQVTLPIPCLPGIPLVGCQQPQPQPNPPPQPGPNEPACRFERRTTGSDFVGLVSEDVFGGDALYRECALGLQVISGVGLVRQTFRWSDIEVARGRYDWRVYDAYVATMANHGIKILPIIFDPPRFRAKRGRERGTYPPRRYSDLGKFGARLVRRYGPNGSLWSSLPQLPKVPITSWQIWNEPNLPVYWPTGPRASDYAKLLKAASREIKKADPNAEIVTAGMPESRLAPQPLLRYIRRLYRAGAKSSFDTLAINPYASRASGVIKQVRQVRRLMNRRRDRGGRIWLTEIGWSDRGPPSAFRVGANRQAAQVRDALRSLSAKRSSLGVRGVVYFSWKDGRPYKGGKDFWGLHTGLHAVDGRPKLAYYSFAAAAKSLP
jgi:hypothetical protein